MDADYIQSITPDVLAALTRQHIFTLLDDRMSPNASTVAPQSCKNDFSILTGILIENSFNAEDQQDILSVLRKGGAHCDCEVLYNVAPENRLKANYWKSRARHE